MYVLVVPINRVTWANKIYIRLEGLSYSSYHSVMASHPIILPPLASQRSPLCLVCASPGALQCVHCPTGCSAFCSVAHYHEVRCFFSMSQRIRLIALIVAQHWWQAHGGTAYPVHTIPQVMGTSVTVPTTPSAPALAYTPFDTVEVRQETVVSYVLGVRNRMS